MAGTYSTLFPVTPETPLGAADGDKYWETCANEIRTAIQRRADQIGLDISGDLPAVVDETITARKTFITGCRAAIETILTDAKYGYWESQVWTILTKAKLCSYVKNNFVNNGLSQANDWMLIAHEGEAAGSPDKRVMYAGHMNELYYACELLIYLEIAAPNLTANSREDRAGNAAGEANAGAAYTAGWDDWDGNAWGAGAGANQAFGSSDLYTNGGFHYDISGRRADDISIDIPNYTYAVKQLFVSMSHNSPNDLEPTNFSLYDAADFGGSSQEGLFRVGDFSETTFDGWAVLTGLNLDNETFNMSFEIDYLARNEFGTPAVHTHMCSLTMGGYEYIAGFDFSGYGNGAVDWMDFA